jgi:hypothetical protein
MTPPPFPYPAPGLTPAAPPCFRHSPDTVSTPPLPDSRDLDLPAASQLERAQARTSAFFLNLSRNRMLTQACKWWRSWARLERFERTDMRTGKRRRWLMVWRGVTRTLVAQAAKAAAKAAALENEALRGNLESASAGRDAQAKQLEAFMEKLRQSEAEREALLLRLQESEKAAAEASEASEREIAKLSEALELAKESVDAAAKERAEMVSLQVRSARTTSLSHPSPPPPNRGHLPSPASTPSFHAVSPPPPFCSCCGADVLPSSLAYAAPAAVPLAPPLPSATARSCFAGGAREHAARAGGGDA